MVCMVDVHSSCKARMIVHGINPCQDLVVGSCSKDVPDGGIQCGLVNLSCGLGLGF